MSICLKMSRLCERRLWREMNGGHFTGVGGGDLACMEVGREEERQWGGAEGVSRLPSWAPSPRRDVGSPERPQTHSLASAPVLSSVFSFAPISGHFSELRDSHILSPYTNPTDHEISLILKLPLCGLVECRALAHAPPQCSAPLGRSWQRHNHCAFTTPKALGPNQTITAQLYRWQQGTSNRALRL